MCRARKVFFHTDAAQAIGKIPLDVNHCNIDLMSISGHKIYGPKGLFEMFFVSFDVVVDYYCYIIIYVTAIVIIIIMV